MMSNRTMASRMIYVAVVLGTMVVITRGVPTTRDTPTEFTTDISEVTYLGAEEKFTEEVTTLPNDDEAVTMTTENTFSPDKEGDEERQGIYNFIKVKFTLPGKSNGDIGGTLRTDIKNAINPILSEKFEEYNTSSVAFSECKDDCLTATVKLDFRLRITLEERRGVIKVLYEIVERNQTLGNLRVEMLYVLNVKGSYERIHTACDITHCKPDMKCFIEGNDCSSVCADNTEYCHHGRCEKFAQQSFITCHCEEGFTGPRCTQEIGNDESDGKPDLYVGIIAASAIACIIVLAIILATCINIFNKKRIRTGRSEELFGIENVVALELMDEKSQLDGMATQTDESFLLARSHKDGVAPKAGHAHKIMQTNDSFLLAKAQLLRAHGSATRYRGAGSPVGVVSGNTRRLSDRPSESKIPEVDHAEPSTSTAGVNGVARNPSTKKDRAPAPPQQSPASPSQNEEATPSTSKDEQPRIPSAESAPKPAVENEEGNIEVPPPEKPIKSVEGNDVISDAYPGRKILKV
ncbi:uncharacterized protein LOC121410974 isoform X1 [Lytechinus variegatus]|uniref:uncharacterized protein LOC121410974 isoform X1 n=1 Tax=Lytechinus variegatus TaxID=7654 RepID=UPI001BB27FED|nr:uncharacterized protein LOC121410974 isoform X1 [Lytechinus variegatus]